MCWLSASLSSLLALVGTSRYGVGIDTDAVTYLSVTQSLLHGNGFTVYNGTPFVAQPPLFPLLLALIVHTGLHPADAARWLNGVAFGAISALSTLWLLKNVRSTDLALLGSATIVLSKPLLGVSVFAWSEPLFVLFLLLFLYFLGLYGDRESPLAFLFCIFSAALACLTRYVGISVVLTGCLVLLSKRGPSIVRRILTAGAFLVTALLPLAVWCARNYSLTSTLIGPRAPSSLPLQLHVFSAWASVSLWLLPRSIPSVLRAGALAGLSALLLSVILGVHERWKDPLGKRPPDLTPIVPVLWFVPVFSLCSLLAARRVAMDLLGDRLMAPLFVPLVMLACFSIDNIDGRGSAASSERLRRFLLLAFALWLIYPLVSTRRRVLSSLQAGAGALSNHGGFTCPRWVNSALIAYLRQHPLDGVLYSNYPDPIYLFTGIAAVQSPPKFHYHSRKRLSRSILQFQERIGRHRSASLIWFDEPTRPFLYDVNELRSFVPMSVLVRCGDGAIYRLGPQRDYLHPL